MDFLSEVKLKGPSRIRRLGNRLCPRWIRNDFDYESVPLFGRQRQTASVDQSHPDNQRTIQLGHPRPPNQFANNHISTGKYNIITFIPKFLFEQFRKYANIFFLLISCLQQIPGVSPTGRYTTLGPLVLILLLSAIKELIEDIKRHQADRKVNKSKVLALKEGAWQDEKWEDLHVGDYVKLTDGALIPADILLLSSSEPQSIAYIETSNLDGETNLKIRKGVSKTADVLTAARLSQLTGRIVCEGPNRYLYDYVGTLYLDGDQAVPLGPSELLLRGSRLKNTSWIFGVVVYAGEESKLRLNSVKTPLKRSHIEKLTNIQILLLFGTLLFLSMFTSIANVIWTKKNTSKIWYEETHVSNFILQFLTYVILYNNLIPISLQVSLEFVKFAQAFYINWDSDMYHEETNQHAIARTSNLNEELGQIKYIFSDKTGTLTRNVMEFKGCSINGVVYRDDMKRYDYQTLADLKTRVKEGHGDAKHIDKFMRFLAICHTVVPEEQEDGTYTYQASSPDEAALVSGAQKVGWQFVSRTPEILTLRFENETDEYELLNVIDFTSSRKRMSVIVRDSLGVIRLLCKGADSVIFERLAANQSSVGILESHLDEFASVGLRTLCLGERVISDKHYTEWNAKFHAASCAISNRENLVAEVAELIEKELVLVGATAIEDKLQEGVPECISSLSKADIKIWVLTGDKQETAINIGYSCSLLTKSMPLMILNAQSLDDTKAQIASAVLEFGPRLKKDNNVGMIIDGHTLKWALKQQVVIDFLKIAVSCKAVICCRVSPLQKAEIVALVKKYVGAITLAVGDGANDVGMIQAADVGVGIMGLEGTQAVCAADYAIAQFRFLKKLLLVHGTWNYYRICKLVLYSFYKNICVYVIELWFQLSNGYSGQILFERWSIGLYNVVFTFFPPLALGLLDRYTDKEIPMKYPQMYKISQDSTLFNVKVFWMWMVNAIFHSIILYFLPLWLMGHHEIQPDGQIGGYLFLGNAVFGYTVVTVCIKAGLEAYTWTWMHFVAIFGSIASWFLYVAVYSELWPKLPLGAAEEMAGESHHLFKHPIFWFGLALVPIVTLLRDVIWKVLRRTVFLSIKEKVEIFHRQRHLLLSKIPGARDREQQASCSTTEAPGSSDGGVRTSTTSDATAAKFLKKIFAPAAIYQFNPSQASIMDMRKSQHGFAFSQDETSNVRQSELVRMVNSTIQKPEGL